ncbi:oxygen-independent coproporphyrinogen III oxidase [Klebsormidium nitens]|uniref:Radical S-adenosyl methionine domain-containing protein 1, mitochondrial n=1 Tax=Klebsormidium nitens TaxID=105231 RepID=A0A1Y1HTM8_KLENI|nr:oxygen-independent coproporphyrinogen III oxidase [Klebsormidium nitens]|eukprot:GAQ80361.1 oxygen-independent coproporphyrinogen III oxidase [Klebsormidium nitens]
MRFHRITLPKGDKLLLSSRQSKRGHSDRLSFPLLSWSAPKSSTCEPSSGFRQASSLAHHLCNHPINHLVDHPLNPLFHHATNRKINLSTKSLFRATTTPCRWDAVRSFGARSTLTSAIADTVEESSQSETDQRRTQQARPDVEKASSAYIHIPFCKRRCHYCDFPIQVVGSRPENEAVAEGMERYVDTVCQEIDVTRAAADPASFEPLRTVFFGGGTPSLLPPRLLDRLLKKLEHNFGIQSDAEISVEMDPGTFDDDKLRAFMSTGVNRLSMGVQGFQDDLLRQCGRSHGLADVHSAIETVHRSGLSNWSLDLISSLPHQTPELWQHSLDQAVQASPSHVSVYDLQIEEGTAFGRWFKPGEGPLPGDDVAAGMYRQAVATLTAAGYGHYEISNYAKAGYECRHNCVYWNGAPYFAFGLGAASYINRQRFSRPRKMAEYPKWVQQYAASRGVIDWPEDGPEERLLDRLMLRLRLAEGVDLKALKDEFGEEAAQAVCKGLAPFVASGHVIPSEPAASNGPRGKENGVTLSLHSTVRLSDPEGFLLSNEILSTLFAQLPNES